jgi:hypothetical protein
MRSALSLSVRHESLGGRFAGLSQSHCPQRKWLYPVTYCFLNAFPMPQKAEGPCLRNEDYSPL